MEWHKEIQQKLDEVQSRLDKLIAQMQPKSRIYAGEPGRPVATDV